ncbi:Uncharacterised protein [Moraxella lacunata]|uniref:Uncharacterized protein n=1 Tax=Moraxella lacunata TaxID=477 RepID=A0A378T6M5_MORLA|nr:hypothetical protein [Moraxella lacunata]STZ56429.1 Uncharacterised protein [Moraxella lacunata]
MSENNTDTTNHKKWSQYNIFMGVCCLTIGYLEIVHFFSLYEGKIAILCDIITAFFGYVVILVIFSLFLVISETDENTKNKRKSIKTPIIIFSFIGYIIILYFSGLYKNAYYSVFEPSQTIITNEYKVTTYYSKGRYYHITFYDVQNPDKCIGEYGNICRYDLKIKRKTYNRLRKLEPKSNPIRITFKDKAEVVMNIELTQNGL